MRSFARHAEPIWSRPSRSPDDKSIAAHTIDSGCFDISGANIRDPLAAVVGMAIAGLLRPSRDWRLR
jgi:hypothetical protein